MDKILYQNVVEILKKYGIPVNNHFENVKKKGGAERSYIILAESMIIEVNSIDRIIDVSFRVGYPPNSSASVILILKSLDDVKIDISDVFLLVEGLDMMIGLDAIVHWEEHKKEKIIDKYIQEQTEIHFLASIEAPQC